MRIRTAVAAIAITVGLCSSAQALPPTNFGFNDHSFGEVGLTAASSQNAIQDLAKAGGANVQRFTLSWAAVQPGSCNAAPITNASWATYDAVVQRLHDRQMKAVIVIMDAPQWAQGEIGCGILGATSNCQNVNLCHVPPGDRFLAAWGSFVDLVVRRYADDIAAIEVWNEENANHFWGAVEGANAARYARVFRYAANAVHMANDALGKSTPVVTGGLIHKRSVDNDRIAIPQFLNGVYDGALAWMRPIDRIALHPYLDDPSCLATPTNPVSCALGRFNDAFTQMRGVRDTRDPGRKIWVTEFGAATADASQIGEGGQCRLIETVLGILDASTDVESTIIHTLSDRPWSDPGEASAGVVAVSQTPTFTLTPKQAYRAIQNYRGMPGGFACA